jgi:hypothetical protein
MLIDGALETLPFKRTISTAFYDGPTEGITECSQCGQVYSFRKVDWDDLQDVRIFVFAPLNSSLDAIATQLGISLGTAAFRPLVPPLNEQNESIVETLFAKQPKWIAVIESWPGQSLVWRDISGVDLKMVHDWFSFLGISKKKAE